MEIRSMNMQSNVPVAVGNNEFFANNVSVPEIDEVKLVEATAEEMQVEDAAALESVQGEVSHADKILESAKEEGFEEALTRLANGDFDDVEIDEEKKEEMIDELEAKDEETDKVNDEEKLEKTELSEKVALLEQQVTDLESKNKVLFERLSSVESRQNISSQAMLEAILILKALAEEEEDEKKKADILTTVIQFMENLIVMMFVPETEETMKSRNTQGLDNKEHKDPKDNIINLLEVLHKKGILKQEKISRTSDRNDDVIAA